MTQHLRIPCEEYTVGWVCALPVELAAAQEMLDEEHDDLTRESDDNDQNLYSLGSIAGHNVVIVCLPAGRIGNNPAAVVATQMKATFKGIRFALMVGIGGGVPSATADIRLGDVVVSQPDKTFGGVVQYDSGKTTATASGFVRTGSLNAPPQVLLSAVAKVRANEYRGKSKVSEHLRKLERISKFQRSKAGPDVLFDAGYDHEGGQTCEGCRADRYKAREPREEDVMSFYGTIASGNQVIKNASERDRVSAALGGVLCFEMEAAGLMNSFPCLVIRGICDYADSHKNKRWQLYAAGVAASYAKEVLSVIPPTDVADTRTIREVTRGLNGTRPAETFQAMLHWGQEDHQFRGLANLDPKLQAPKRTIDPSLLSDSSSSSAVVAGLQPLLSAHGPDFKLDSSILSEMQLKESQLGEKQLKEKRLRELIDSLQFKQRDARLMTLRLAQAKTCRWMLNNLHYKSWIQTDNLNQHHGFFWIKGKPGTGKSIMMKFLFSEAKRTMKQFLLLSFFFNARGENLEQSTSGLYRALLLQLLEKAPKTSKIFENYGISAFETIKSIGWQIETLQELLTMAVQELRNQRVVCFIDALDECPEDDVRDMISFFEELGELEKAAEFRVCFSSRHYPEISIRTGLQLELELEQEHANDITLYVDTHLKLGKSSQAEEIKAEILRKSSGIFLWVHLVIPILNKEYDRGRIKALKERLAEIPTGLHDLFLDILTRDHKNVKGFLVCTQVILFATRPFTPDELRIAVETYCEDGYTPGPYDPIQMTAENLRKFVLDTSKGLAEITDSRFPIVQFIHESVRDFLLEDGGLNKLQPTAWNPRGLGHNTLKEICLLQFTALHSGKTGYKERVDLPKRESNKFTLLRYASSFVLYHANWAQRLGLDQTSFLEKFDLRTWLLVRDFPDKRKTNLLYLLSERGLADLIRIHPERSQHFEFQGGDFGYPLLAALFTGYSAAARTLLNLPPFFEKPPFGLQRFRLALRSEFKKNRHVLSYLCEFGDTDMLRIVWISGRFEVDPAIAKECFEHASSEAVVDTLAELGACEIFYPNGMYEAEGFSLSLDDEMPTLNGLRHLQSALKKNPSIVNDASVWGHSLSLLAYAATKGFDLIAKLCIKDTPSRNKDDAFESAIRSSLNRSGRRGRSLIVKCLLQEGLQRDTDFIRIISGRIFDLICRPLNEAVVAMLLITPFFDIKAHYPGFFATPSWAVIQGRKAYCKLFLSFASVSVARNHDGATALLCGVSVNDLSSFRCILDHARCDLTREITMAGLPFPGVRWLLTRVS